MAYLIENNAFTGDTYGIRATRLYFLSNSVDTYAVDLSITGDMLTWAQGAVAAFDALQVAQTAEIGEKNEAFQTSQEADQALAERYQILKELLQARYGEENDQLKVYGIMGPTPKTHAETIDTAEALIEGHDRLTVAADPDILPQTMIDNLQVLVDAAKDNYYLAGIERSESEQATIAINELYEQDSIKLRALYSWVVAYWGKYDPRLIELGFAVATRRGGGVVLPEAPELEYSSSGFEWEAVENATSYQLVFKAPGAPEWEELYYGDMPTAPIPFAPGDGEWLAKIRARNTNGYGDWSEEVSLMIGIDPPGSVTLDYSGPAVNLLILNWYSVEGAETYEVWKCVVAIGAPEDVYSKVGERLHTPYEETATPGMRSYFYLKTKIGEYVSEPSAKVHYDVPVIP